MGYEKRFPKDTSSLDLLKSVRTIKDMEGAHDARAYAPGETQSVRSCGENGERYHLIYRAVQLQGDHFWELLSIKRV